MLLCYGLNWVEMASLSEEGYFLSSSSLRESLKETEKKERGLLSKSFRKRISRRRVLFSLHRRPFSREKKIRNQTLLPASLRRPIPPMKTDRRSQGRAIYRRTFIPACASSRLAERRDKTLFLAVPSNNPGNSRKSRMTRLWKYSRRVCLTQR